MIKRGAFVYKVSRLKGERGGREASPNHYIRSSYSKARSFTCQSAHSTCERHLYGLEINSPESHPSPQMEILRFDRGRQIFAEMIFTLIKNLCNVKIAGCWCPSALFIHPVHKRKFRGSLWPSAEFFYKWNYITIKKLFSLLLFFGGAPFVRFGNI